MEPSSSDNHNPTTRSEPTMDGRRSHEAVVPTSRLHKQRSNHGMRAASHGQPFAMSGSGQGTALRDSSIPGGFGDGTKARKGSIRK